jgi:beta-lactamase class A
MISNRQLKSFERHHFVLLLFLFIAGVFLINIFAFKAVYSRVSPQTNSKTALQPAKLDNSVNTTNNASKSDARKAASTLDSLDKDLLAVVERYDSNFAIVVQDLKSGDYLGINDTTTFVSASLYKIFVSYEVARRAELGLINLDSPSGSEAGNASIEECLDRMLSYSDNDCGRALRKLIGADDAPLTNINDAGFVGTSLVNDYPTTSARDVALYFEKLYKQSDFSAAINNLLLDSLLAQQINNRLPQGLPGGTKIAHKTADLDGYSHDGGIVYTKGGDYIIVVMSGPWENGYTDSPQSHKEISNIVFRWFNPTLEDSSF